jgi:hypothetical protein
MTKDRRLSNKNMDLDTTKLNKLCLDLEYFRSNIREQRLRNTGFIADHLSCRLNDCLAQEFDTQQSWNSIVSEWLNEASTFKTFCRLICSVFSSALSSHLLCLLICSPFYSSLFSPFLSFTFHLQLPKFLAILPNFPSPPIPFAHFQLDLYRCEKKTIAARWSFSLFILSRSTLFERKL